MSVEKGFRPTEKGILDRKSSKVSPDSLDVKRDGLVNKISRIFWSGKNDEPVYENMSGRVGERQRKNFEALKNKVEKEWLPEFGGQFLEKLDVLRAEGDLEITPEEIKKRMKDVRVSFFDKGSLKAVSIDAGGVTTPFSAVMIELDPSSGDEDVLKEDLQHTYNHEMLHVVSGSLFLTTPRHLGIYNTEKYRRGLAFGPRAEGEQVERFTWLNEAVTETLALQMDRDKDRDSAPYKPERLLLSLLINGPAGNSEVKVERKKFSQAYFENYVAEKDADERLQNWKELVHSINEKYYPGFLVDIDKLIKEKGIGFVISRFHVLCEGKEEK